VVQAAPVAGVLEQAGLGVPVQAVPVRVEIRGRAEDPEWAARPEAQVLAAWVRVAREAPPLPATQLTADDLVSPWANRARDPHARRAKPVPVRRTRDKCEPTSPTSSGASSVETLCAVIFAQGFSHH
jgi:hypothetical protein